MTHPTRVAQQRGQRHPTGRDRLTAIPAVALALLLLLGMTGLALAAGPRLTNSVTDQAEVLTPGEEATIANVLKGLRDSHGIQLFVAFVETTGADTVTDYTAALADDNSLGGNDALLVVAIEDRSDALWVGPSLDAVTNDEIDAILVDVLEPGLAGGDFAGAVVATADALADASVVDVPGTPSPTTAPGTAAPATAAPGGSGGGSGSGSGGGLDITLVIIVLIVGVGGFLVVRSILSRRASAKVAAAEGDQLNRDANRLLLETDEALKDATNDVEFAAAQWGDAEVVPYRDAIKRAGEELRAAFSIRQRLDDAQPETAAPRLALLQEIVARTTTANHLLDAQEARFDQLQDLERTAPEQLTAAGQAIETQRARRVTAAATLDRLMAGYAPSATGSITGNLSEADKALEAAAADVDHGRSLVATKRSEAVVALRSAQDDLARATHLVDAVERLAVELDGAAAKVPNELAAARSDVEAARKAIQHAAPGAASTQAAEALRAADQALAEARRAAEAHPLDPLAALQQATAANQAADAIVSNIRQAEEQERRRRETASTAVSSARGHVTRAVDYITTRRHAVGREARTRAAEAEAQLDQAMRLVDTEPEGAAAAAARAAQLADEAYRLAAAEFDALDAGRGGPGGGSAGGPDLGMAILGGIIGAAMSGGGRGGWGGSPWGGPSGGARPGPFGGGGGGRVGGGGFGR
ncbi:MAG: TPM domain-containing protein, partial [Candidatus Limnocylindrales bacterium]